MNQVNQTADLKRVPLVVRLTLVLASLGVAAYWIFMESGLYRWLLVFQLEHFSEVQIWLTWGFTVLLVLTPMLFLLWLSSKLLSSTPRKNDIQEVEHQSAKVNDWLQNNSGTFFGYMSGTAGILVFVGFMLSAVLRGPLTSFHVRELEQGQAPQSHYVEITGVANEDQKIIIEQNENSHSSEAEYVPLYSSNDFNSAVSVWIRRYPFQNASFQKDQKQGHFQGLLSWGPAPAIVRYYANQKGILSTQVTYQLQYGHTPSEEYEDACALGGTLMGIGLVTLAYVRFKANRLRHAKQN